MADTTASGSQAREKAEQVTEQAQDKVREGAEQARGRLRDEVDRRSTQAGEQVRSTADALRSTSGQLRQEGKDGPARIAEQAAERGERLGSYLHDSSADRILDDVEDFARRQPLAVAAAGLALGFAAARFLKASSAKRYESRSGREGDGRLGASPAYASSSTPALDALPRAAAPAAPDVEAAAGTSEAPIAAAEPTVPRRRRATPPTTPLDPPSAGY